jgi:SEC-C motif
MTVQRLCVYLLSVCLFIVYQLHFYFLFDCSLLPLHAGAKPMKKQRHGKPAKVKPDEQFAAGPFEFARFGRFLMARSHATPEQWKFAEQKKVAIFPEVVVEIDNLVLKIAQQLARLSPERVLQRAWWEFAIIMTGIRDSSDADRSVALRMIDYVQSVIASTAPSLPYTSDISEDDWQGLRSNVQLLFERLTGEYQLCLTAKLRSENPDLNMELEEFRFKAEFMWLNVRGKRYQVHERTALLEILEPHSPELVRLFGIDAVTLVGELGKIQDRLTNGVQEVAKEMESLRNDSIERMEALMKESGINDIEQLRDVLFADAELAARRDKVMGAFIGMDLFDVGKSTSLPMSLLNELAWLPGQDQDFFSAGANVGWPLRIWPIMRRPFLRVEDKIYCFDLYALFDNFYRVLQRIVFRLDQGYRQTWNNLQKAASEALPLKYLLRLLPDATTFESVHYRWKVKNDSVQWTEADALLIYDDHLFVIEVKAGSFKYTSPANDLPVILDSLRDLILSPANQGNRFVDYLESAHEVALFDASHVEVGRLRRSSFRTVTICAVSLDAFTELAARSQHLKKVGLDVGHRPIWALSVDDLRVYADLFDNPLTFLHFVEQRLVAAKSDLVDLNDEIAHLGMYIKENNYSRFAQEIADPGNKIIAFEGYREPIDAYYRDRVSLGSALLPSQKIPARLSEIIAFLGASQKPGRSMVASFLLDAAGDHREMITKGIDQQLLDNPTLRRIRPISTYGEHAFTFCAWSPAVPRNADLALQHAQTVVAADNQRGRLLLELEYSAAGRLIDVHWQEVLLDRLSKTERTNILQASVALRRKLVTMLSAQRKISPNEQCPCRSGKKYKRCCRQ